MKFIIQNLKRSINDIMRQVGYSPAYFQNEGEFSVIRKIRGTDYPRFHLYIKEVEKGFEFNLHLDQKKPSYEGSTAHSGEYDGEVVIAESERIMMVLN